MSGWWQFFSEQLLIILISSPPRKIHFPLQSWHNPMRILYWKRKAQMAALGDLNTFTLQNQRGGISFLKHLTVWGGHLRNPKTWVKKCVYSEKFIMLLIFEATYIYVYILLNICVYTYIQCSCNETKSFWIFRGGYPSLTLFKTDGVNPDSESWELSAMTGFVLELFFALVWSNGINMWFELWNPAEPQSLFAPFPATWNHWVGFSSNPLTLTTFRAISVTTSSDFSFSL